jgi:hypothetical protein
MLSWRRAIQFAPDPSLDPAWFHSYEGSQYGGENSLDVQNIDRPSDAYDFISLSSVLELVPDDRRAFRELLRIGSANCIIHCTFVPLAAATRHYDEPHGDFGRYHLYGLDVDEWFDTTLFDLTTLVTTGVDPVTGIEDPIHFFCRRDRDAEVLRASFAAMEPVADASAQTTPGMSERARSSDA